MTLDRGGINDDRCSYKLKIREQGSITCRTNFDSYPFDVQRCPLTIRSYTEDDSRIKLFWRPQMGDAADERFKDVKMLEYGVELNRYDDSDTPWFFPANHAKIEDPLGEYRPFTGVRLEIVFNRKVINMFYNAYLPCILLILVGMFTFSMSLESFPERMIITTSILLSFYTIYSALSNGLPKAAIMTYLDQFLLFTMMFMTLVTIQPIAVRWYLRRLRGGARREGTQAFNKEMDLSLIQSSDLQLRKEDEQLNERIEARRFDSFTAEERILYRTRRVDSLMKYPLIVIMIAYLTAHFVGAY